MFSLEKGSRKHICPNCGRGTFVRFVNEIGEYFGSQFGRCDREIKCRYFKIPESNYFFDFSKYRVKDTHIVEYVPCDYYEKLDSFKNSCFYKQLIKKADVSLVDKVFKLYKIKSINFKTCFPFIDKKNRINVVQVKTFENLKTKKNLWLHYETKDSWTHQYKKSTKKVNCLFGDHLLSLKEFSNNVAVIVESPKCAIICAISQIISNVPKNKIMLYLASGALSWIAENKLPVDRKVLVLPDASTDDRATQITKRLTELLTDNECYKSNQNYILTTLDRLCSDEQKAQGYDISDYILDNQMKIEI